MTQHTHTLPDSSTWDAVDDPITPTAEQPKESAVSAILTHMKSYMNLATFMRAAGVFFMLAAMVVFLSQKWENSTDISRFYMLLTETGLLALTAFGLSYFLRENKGARLLFGLSLISVIVNVTTLAALTYSHIQWGGSLVEYPSIAQWQATNLTSIAIAGAIAVMLCVPISHFAFRILMRPSASAFSAAFLGCNLLLLLPIREGVLMSLVMGAALLIPALTISRVKEQRNRFSTLEGYAAIGTLFLPAAIIFCRSVWLYPMSELLVLILASMAFIALRTGTRNMDKDSTIAGILDWFSLFIAGIIGLAFFDVAENFLSHEFIVSLAVLLTSGLFVLTSMTSRFKHSFIGLATILVSAYHVPLALFGDTELGAIMAVIAGVLITVTAMKNRLKTPMLWGIATVAAGIFGVSRELIGLVDFGNWITLSLLGGGIIITASVLEHYGASLHYKLKQFWNKRIA